MLRGCLKFVLSVTPTVFITLYSNFCLMVVHTWKMCTFYFVQISFFFTFLTDVELWHFQANFVLWLFTHWTCTPYIYAHLILYFWVFNLEIVKSPTVDYIVKFGCNLISFLYIWTLHIDCSHTDVHRRRRSRAEFGLVYPYFHIMSYSSNFWSFRGQNRTIVWLIVIYSCKWVVTTVFSLGVDMYKHKRLYLVHLFSKTLCFSFTSLLLFFCKSWWHFCPTLELTRLPIWIYFVCYTLKEFAFSHDKATNSLKECFHALAMD